MKSRGEGTEDDGVANAEPSDRSKESSRPSGTSSGPSISLRGARRRGIFLWVLLMGLLFIWFRSVQLEDDRVRIGYTTFLSHVEDGRVEQVTLRGDRVQADLVESVVTPAPGAEEPVEYDRLVTYVPAMGDPRLLELLESEGVDVVTEPEAAFSWWLVLIYVLPVLLIVGFMILFLRGMRSQGQQMMSIGRNKAKAFERTEEATTFDDVAGQEEAKRELLELVSFLKDPSHFERLGAKIPKGFLLVGPPGTGKTLLARAVAGEAQVPFFHVSGSDFMEMLVGVGAARVRDLFKEAKEASPAIVFIDELDSIGRKRGAGLGGGHDEREQTLNQLLAELDGFEPNQGVVAIAATNRPDILDPALLRPGRFDRRVMAGLPTLKDREAILRIHARRKPLEPELDFAHVARGTPGFSGADLENLLNEAALLTARKDQTEITLREVEEARDKVLMGLEREGLTLGAEERRLLAYHESGHAVAAATVAESDPIHKVTIVPRGQALGVTQQLPEEDRYLHTRESLLGRLTVLMAGRAAEEMMVGTITTGAEDDFRQASRLARKMVLSWGMSEEFGHVAPVDGGDQVFLGEEITQRREYSDSTAREVDEQVRAMVGAAYGRARSLLETHREGLERLAGTLLEEEEVSGRKVLELLGMEAGGDGAEAGNGRGSPPKA